MRANTKITLEGYAITYDLQTFATTCFFRPRAEKTRTVGLECQQAPCRQVTLPRVWLRVPYLPSQPEPSFLEGVATGLDPRLYLKGSGEEPSYEPTIPTVLKMIMKVI